MKQVRFLSITDCGLQVREAGEGQEQSRRVKGTPIVFGVRSVNLTPWSSTRKVYEVLEPGCITAELLRQSDVVLNVNHSMKVTDILGRWRSGEGTLKLELKKKGVDSDCDFPHTQTANDTLELIKRGDVSGMSFAFEDDYEDTENGVSYERTNEIEDGKEVWIRHVKRVVALYDVSVVTFPAYEQTSVATREQNDAINDAIERQLQGAGETDEEKKAREAREQQEREANGGETNAEKEAREKQEREANGGETNAEKQAREKAEKEAREKQEREAAAARYRYLREQRRRLNEEMIDMDENY